MTKEQQMVEMAAKEADTLRFEREREYRMTIVERFERWKGMQEEMSAARSNLAASASKG